MVVTHLALFKTWHKLNDTDDKASRTVGIPPKYINMYQNVLRIRYKPNIISYFLCCIYLVNTTQKN